MVVEREAEFMERGKRKHPDRALQHCAIQPARQTSNVLALLARGLSARHVFTCVPKSIREQTTTTVFLHRPRCHTAGTQSKAWLLARPRASTRCLSHTSRCIMTPI